MQSRKQLHAVCRLHNATSSQHWDCAHAMQGALPGNSHNSPPDPLLASGSRVVVPELVPASESKRPVLVCAMPPESEPESESESELVPAPAPAPAPVVPVSVFEAVVAPATVCDPRLTVG